MTYRSKEDNMEATTDASFIDCEGSKSTEGYVIKLFGDTVAWKSHKQGRVSKSTCEAEYIAMSEANAEIVSLDKAIRDIIGKTMYPVIIWTDNRSARDCTEMDGSHKLKNFDYNLEEIKRRLREREETDKKRYMSVAHGDYVKLCALEGRVIAKWVPTNENIADVMTKPLPNKALEYFRKRILNLEI